MTQLNTQRHAELFKPEEFHTPVTVIGAGATGSWVVLQLAKLGITNITVWDFDTVEEHNVPNQAYGLEDVGYSKVGSLQKLIECQTHQRINVKPDKFIAGRLSGIVFLMVDSMKVRDEIWKNSIKMKQSVKLLVEPRMGLDVGRVYNVDPTNLTHIKAYEDTYYSDDEAEVSSCGSSMSVITTAMSVAATCVRQLINFHNEVELDNEILLDFKYNNTIAQQWKA